MKNYKLIIVVLFILLFQLYISALLTAQYEDIDNDSDFSAVYEDDSSEGKIKYEDLTLSEQIQMGYYKDAIDKYVKQLDSTKDSMGEWDDVDREKPSYKSDASYALSKIMQIEKHSRPVESLIKALDEKPYTGTIYIRRYAALSLGYTEDERAIKPLIRAMNRTTIGEREITAEQIKEFTEQYGRPPKDNDIDPILEKKSIPEDLYVRVYACFSLGLLRAKEAARDIASILEKQYESRILRRQAAISLGMILDEGVYGKLARTLEKLEQDKLILRNVIWSLGEYGKFGDKNEFVMNILLSIAYKSKPEAVIDTYIALEKLLYTDKNDETDKMIDKSIEKLEEAISTEQYRKYLNTLKDADKSTITNEATSSIRKFIRELKKIKEATTTASTINNIRNFLNRIKTPDSFEFPAEIVLLKDYDRLIIRLENRLKEFEEIDISSSKRESIKSLLENAYKALFLLKDDKNAIEQANVYLEAKIALEQYDKKLDEDKRIKNPNEPVAYLDNIKDLYKNALESLDNFYYAYARREAIVSIGKIYINTYITYKRLYENLNKLAQFTSNTLSGIIKDKIEISNILKSVIGAEYAEFFTKQVGNDEIMKISEGYIESVEGAITSLMKIVRDYYLYPIHDYKEVAKEKIENKKIYSKEPKYKREDIETKYTKKEIEKIISKSTLSSYDKEDFDKLIQKKDVITIIKTETNEEIIGKPISYDANTKLLILEVPKSANKEFNVKTDIEKIIIYTVPEGFMKEKIVLMGSFGELVGELIKELYDEKGKKIIIKTANNEEKEAYLKDVNEMMKYNLPLDIVGQKVIVNYEIAETGETTEMIGEIIGTGYDEIGKFLTMKTPRGNQSIYLRYLNNITTYTLVNTLIGEKVIVRLFPHYIGSKNKDDYENFVIGILVDEKVDKIVLQTVEIDDLYNKQEYYRDIYIKDIERIAVDYSIPDILNMGIKSIEIDELANKLKYDKENSIMSKLDNASKKLNNISSKQGKFPKLGLILTNAVETLKSYPDSAIAKDFRISLEKVINIINQMEASVDECSRKLSAMKDQIENNIHYANFELKSIRGELNKDETQPDIKVSALNNILVDLLQNDKDIFVRLNSLESLVKIDYPDYIDDLAIIFSNEQEPYDIRVLAFNTLKNQGFPKYLDYSKKDLENPKFSHIKAKLEEINEAKKLFEQTIYINLTITSQIYDDPKFEESHVLRALSIMALANINTTEAFELLLSIIETQYPPQDMPYNKISKLHRILMNKLRCYAIRVIVNKELNKEQFRKTEVVLANQVLNLDETLDVRIDSARGIGKLSKQIPRIAKETGEPFKLRPEIIDILIFSLTTANDDFKGVLIWTLGELKADSSVIYINAILYGPYTIKEIKKKCLLALAKIGNDEAIQTLKSFAKNRDENLLELRDFARMLLGKMGIKWYN